MGISRNSANTNNAANAGIAHLGRMAASGRRRSIVGVDIGVVATAAMMEPRRTKSSGAFPPGYADTLLLRGLDSICIFHAR